MPKWLFTVGLVLLITSISFAGKKKPEPDPIMPDVTARGRALYEYDQAAWHATDAAQAMHPPDQSVGRYLALNPIKEGTVYLGIATASATDFLSGTTRLKARTLRSAPSKNLNR